MTAQELRIGNIIHNNYSGAVVVEGIVPIKNPAEPYGPHEIIYRALNHSVLGQNNITSFQFMPISEEWLNKFGLLSNKYGNFKEITGRVHIFITYDNNGEQYIPNSSPIEYVHQLQNLWFAMTGTELIST